MKTTRKAGEGRKETENMMTTLHSIERARERIRNRARFEKYNRCYAEAGWTV